MRRLFDALCRLWPLLGWFRNAVVYPRVHGQTMVELPPRARFCVNGKISIGALTRLYVTGRGSISIGDRVTIGRDAHIQADDARVEIGDFTGVQDRCRLLGDVRIGRCCILAPNVFISSSHHVFAADPAQLMLTQEKAHPPAQRPVIVEDDCWLGINTVILPGVRVGRGAVVAANSVVRTDVPPYAIVAGAPATVRGARLKFAPPNSISADEPHHLPYFYAGFRQLDAPPRNGFSADRDFCVALAAASPAFLELDVDSEKEGKVRLLGGGGASLAPGRQSIRLAISGESGPFWKCATEVALRLFAARLIGDTN